MADAGWTRVENFDENVSFEAPCTLDEIIFNGDVEQAAKGAPVAPVSKEARCEKDGFIYIVHIMDGSAFDGVTGLYDSLVPEVASDPLASGKPTFRQFDGHRAIFTQGQESDSLAAKGFIEINPAKVALVMIAGGTEHKISLGDQRNLIDRFLNSVRVRDQ